MSANWLVDAENPLLTQIGLSRIDDARRPDRLAWNAFRTLALWETDAWVPRLLDVACGAGNPLAALEWSGASVIPWATGLALDDAADVLLDGPEALVVAVATLRHDLAVDELRAGVLEAVAGTQPGGKPAGFVAVVPPGAAGLDHRLAEATAADRPEEIDRPEEVGADELVAGATGWLTWPELGTLAVDLAEESDELRAEQVHRLVSELQEQFPDIEV